MQKWTESPLWSSWSSFSLTLTFMLSLHFNHSLTHPPPPVFLLLFFFLTLFFISIALLSQPRLSNGAGCSTNFSHPFYSCHSTISQKHFESAGEAFSHWLLPHSNFFLFCFSLDFSKFFFVSFHLIFFFGLFVPFPVVLWPFHSVSTLAVLGQVFFSAFDILQKRWLCRAQFFKH